jgi:hypothetical protein
LKQHCILGTDYYKTNEHRVSANGHTRASGEVFGYSEITRQYHDRYRLPVMHTETNLVQGPNGDEAVLWLWKEWANVLRLRNVGIPTVGFTWYSLTDQIDWDSALRFQNGNVNPLGLYDLDRKIRPVARPTSSSSATGVTSCRRRASASSCPSSPRPRQEASPPPSRRPRRRSTCAPNPPRLPTPTSGLDVSRRRPGSSDTMA